MRDPRIGRHAPRSDRAYSGCHADPTALRLLESTQVASVTIIRLRYQREGRHASVANRFPIGVRINGSGHCRRDRSRTMLGIVARFRHADLIAGYAIRSPRAEFPSLTIKGLFRLDRHGTSRARRGCRYGARGGFSFSEAAYQVRQRGGPRIFSLRRVESAVRWCRIIFFAPARSCSRAPQGCVALPQGSFALTQGCGAPPQGSFITPQGCFALPQGCDAAPQGDVALQKGRGALRTGAGVARRGRDAFRQGEYIARQNCDTPPSGRVAIPDVSFTTSCASSSGCHAAPPGVPCRPNRVSFGASERVTLRDITQPRNKVEGRHASRANRQSFGIQLLRLVTRCRPRSPMLLGVVARFGHADLFVRCAMGSPRARLRRYVL